MKHLTQWRHFNWNRLLSAERAPHFILAVQGVGNRSVTTEATFVWVVKATSHTNPVTCCKRGFSGMTVSWHTFGEWIYAWGLDTSAASQKCVKDCLCQTDRTKQSSRVANKKVASGSQQTLAHNAVERTFGKRTLWLHGVRTWRVTVTLMSAEKRMWWSTWLQTLLASRFELDRFPKTHFVYGFVFWQITEAVRNFFRWWILWIIMTFLFKTNKKNNKTKTARLENRLYLNGTKKKVQRYKKISVSELVA